MGKPAREPLKNPYDVVIQRARTYIFKRKYIQVIVFSTWVSEVRALRYEFGGNIYRHGTGYVWLLAKRDELVSLVEKTSHLLPSKTGFENIILEAYIQKEARK